MYSSRFKVAFICFLLSSHAATNSGQSPRNTPTLKTSSYTSSLPFFVPVASPFSGTTSRSTSSTSFVPQPNFALEDPKPIIEEPMDIDKASLLPDFDDWEFSISVNGDCSLDAVSANWDVVAEKEFFTSELRQRQEVFMNNHFSRKGKEVLLAAPESSSPKAYLGRFVFGRGFYRQDADHLNTTFQSMLFKLLKYDFPIVYPQTILSKNIVDFSFLIQDLQTNQFETFLTLMCLLFPNDMDKLRILIQNYPPELIDQSNSIAATPLRIAVLTSNLELVRELITAGADMNDTCFNRMSPFWMSITLHDHSIFNYFVSTGKFDLNACIVSDGSWINFFSLAVDFLTINEIIFLLQAPSEHALNNAAFASFVLHLFTQNRQAFVNSVLLLTSTVKMPHVLNIVAELAVKQDHLEVVKILHENGHDLSFDCYSENGSIVKLIHLAILQGNFEMVNLLLELGADVNTLIGGKESLIIFAARLLRTDICLELVRRGAFAGLGSYIKAVISCNKLNYLVHILRVSPNNLTNLSFSNGLNMFTYAVSVDRPQVLKTLFTELGFDIFKADSQGNTIFTTMLPANPSVELIALLKEYRLALNLANIQ